MADLGVAALGIADYEQAIAAQPEIGSNYWHLGLLYLLADDFDAAQSVWLSGLMQLDGEDPNPVAELLDLLQAEATKQLSDRPDLAEALCQQALELAAESEQTELWFCLGQAVALQGRLEAALEHWQQAIELNPNWAAPYRQQAEVWQRLEDYERATVAYRHASDVSKNWDSTYRLGLCYGQLQDWQAACAMFQLALQQNQLAGIQADLGVVLLRLGQLEPALNQLRQGLQATPEFVSAYIQTASSLNAEFLATICDPNRAEQFPAVLQQLIAQSSTPIPKSATEPTITCPPPDGFYATTESWASDHPDCYLPLEPASIMRLKPPKTLDQLHFSFRFGREMRLPEAFVARIPQGRIWIAADQSSRAVFADNCLLGDLSAEFPLLSPDSLLPAHSAQSRWLPQVEQIQGRVVALVGLTDAMYFHWMFEVLPQIELIRRSGLDWEHVDYIQVSHSQPFQQQTLDLLGIPANKLLPNPVDSLHLQASELILASPGCPAWMPSWACEFLRQLLLDSNSPVPSLRLYISRQQVSRSVINEAELLALLEPLGFQTVMLESLSVQQQANLLAEAEAVIAPHGGGLTNLVFCQPGTKVIELFPPDFVYPCYWLVANLVELEYYYLLGSTPVGFYLNQLLYPNPRLADIWVDLKQLKALLQLAGLS